MDEGDTLITTSGSVAEHHTFLDGISEGSTSDGNVSTKSTTTMDSSDSLISLAINASLDFTVDDGQIVHTVVVVLESRSCHVNDTSSNIITLVTANGESCDCYHRALDKLDTSRESGGTSTSTNEFDTFSNLELFFVFTSSNIQSLIKFGSRNLDVKSVIRDIFAVVALVRGIVLLASRRTL